MRLKIELIPRKSWGRNCRTMLKPGQWDILRKYMYWKKDYECEICGNQGKKHPVECHEVWKYNDKTQIQKLVKLEVLCPTCHKAKHMGRTILNKPRSKKHKRFQKRVLKHFRKINKIEKWETKVLLHKALNKNYQRSNIYYKVDISLAKKLLKKIKNKYY